MARKRGQEEGTIYKRKDGLWISQASVQGRRVTKYTKTQREGMDWLRLDSFPGGGRVELRWGSNVAQRLSGTMVRSHSGVREAEDPRTIRTNRSQPYFACLGAYKAQGLTARPHPGALQRKAQSRDKRQKRDSLALRSPSSAKASTQTWDHWAQSRGGCHPAKVPTERDAYHGRQPSPHPAPNRPRYPF